MFSDLCSFNRCIIGGSVGIFPHSRINKVTRISQAIEPRSKLPSGVTTDHVRVATPTLRADWSVSSSLASLQARSAANSIRDSPGMNMSAKGGV